MGGIPHSRPYPDRCSRYFRKASPLHAVGYNASFVAGLICMVTLEFGGLGACEIKRHPEVETHLLTGDNHTTVAKNVLDRLMGGINQSPCS